VSVAYDSGGRRSTLTEPGGGVFTYSFDSASRLTGVQNPQGERTTWAYDLAGRVSTLTYASTATVTYSYDAAARTTGVRNAKSDGTAIAGFVYTLDGVGNPTGMVLSNGDRVTWTYDSLDRLTREQRDGANAYDITYTYDATSNRLTKLASGTTTTYSYDNADALLTENAGGTLTTYAWDDCGNNTLVQAAGGTTTMTWDGENRLSTIQLPAASVVTNTYGFDGLRKKREDGSTTKYLWDAQRLLLETDGNDAAQAVYTSSLGAYGNVVSQRRGATSSYLHPDHLGTIWAVTGSDQSTSDSYVFDAWGRQLASTGSTTNPHRYVGALGYYTEPTLSLQYVRARWLRPSTGSWLSVDPVRGRAPYRYADVALLRMADASGLEAIPLDPGEYPWCGLAVVWPWEIGVTADDPKDGWLCADCWIYAGRWGEYLREWKYCWEIHGTKYPGRGTGDFGGPTPPGEHRVRTTPGEPHAGEEGAGTSFYPIWTKGMPWPAPEKQRPWEWYEFWPGDYWRRSGIWIHEDCKEPGTLGCAGIIGHEQFEFFQEMMEQIRATGDQWIDIVVPPMKPPEDGYTLPAWAVIDPRDLYRGGG